MCSVATDLRSIYVSGIGVMLHFRWQFAILLWSLLMFVMMGLVSILFRSTNAFGIQYNPSSFHSFFNCNEGIPSAVEEAQVMRAVYFWVISVLYPLTTGAAIWLAASQRQFRTRENARTAKMEDYAVLASGFPEMPGTERVEEEVTAFFRYAFPGLKIIGVSVCWNLREAGDEVVKEVKRQVHKLDISENPKMAAAVVRQKEAEAQQRLRGLGGTGRFQCTPSLKCLDAAMGFGTLCNFGNENAGGRSAELTERKVAEMLNSITSTDAIFVIFDTKAQLQEAVQRTRTGMTQLMFRGEHAITLEHHAWDCEAVEWTNFGFKTRDKQAHIARCLLSVFVIIVVWATVIYAPYAYYLSSFRHGYFLHGAILGLLVAAGNQIVYKTISVLSESCAFKHTGTKQRFYVTSYTAAIFINTVLDMSIALMMAKSDDVEEGIQPGLQHSIYRELLMYLVPMTVLVPFLMEPLAAAMRLYINFWLVRSREDVTAKDAEDCLQCPPFDLTRYGDNLFSAMLCIGSMAFMGCDSWILWGCLFISLLFVHKWDHYRLLRLSSRKFLGYSLLDRDVQWITAVPCALMASGLVFRIYSSQDEHPSYMHKLCASFLVCFAFVLHLSVHLSLIRWLVPVLAPDRHLGEFKPYADVARNRPCSWFTSNPTHCLRSKHIYGHSPPCVPYQVGKEYLMRKNDAIGCYYERTKGYELEKHTANDVQEILDGTMSDFFSLVRNAKALLSGPANDPYRDLSEGPVGVGLGDLRGWNARFRFSPSS
eukprot:gnl/TRDRNA2_/TRDRNA2_154843_c1_seq2.p1 gnl/TRDRNA2_/TRDRNA2_154843_c1~~gnl/TRDRNA2_/TRDRNA2_154843_c1_seq2.p1  ORF type:complete len:788 (-),score=123.62 gnl/TRDRNA2_/TRDRNA2_154843_c1_seq2:196-2487(-)